MTNKNDTENTETNSLETRDYQGRQIFVWEADESNLELTIEVLSDMLMGANIKGVQTESQALELLGTQKWDTFVVDFLTEGVSSSEFIKKVNNYPESILVALSMSSFKLEEEREVSKLELTRRLFEYDKNANASIRV